MSVIGTFERKGLFRFTRGFAFIISILLFTGIVVTIYIGIKDAPKIPTTDVYATYVIGLLPTPQGNSGQASPAQPSVNPSDLEGIIIPNNVVIQKVLGNPQTRMILLTPLREFNKSDRQDVLNQLGPVIDIANAKSLDVDLAVRTYFSEKHAAIERRDSAIAKAKAWRLTTGYTVLAGLGLIALFSLVLVLLAIERNTRGNAHP